MSRGAFSLLALSLCALSLAACRCGTDTPGSSSVAPPGEAPPARPVTIGGPFGPPRVGASRFPGARISPRIFQTAESPDAAVADGS